MISPIAVGVKPLPLGVTVAPLLGLRLHHRVMWRNHRTALGFIPQTREDEK
jgi:hypothetical protein